MTFEMMYSDLALLESVIVCDGRVLSGSDIPGSAVGAVHQ